MLVLSRKSGQEIVINDTTIVRIVRIRGNTIQIGITAPQDVKILRGELVQDNKPQPEQIIEVQIEETDEEAA